ncbi:MAG: heme lyase CcmF/NrfE family subunit [Chlamydiae bacterium]|nr:heme lyase CcmF/NrfE family subunit [Chlamydiota bacterium]MBI3276333.1 heme lyase CcmF/NrfE family subunit [Chlamydiota bacterium]
MSLLGNLSLMSALVFSVYAILSALWGAKINHFAFVQSSRHAVYCVCTLITLAVVCLVSELLMNHFQIEYVAKYSNQALPIPYKIAALWGGQEGSLLFWSWILSCYSVIIVHQNKNHHSSLIPYVIFVLISITFFFLILNVIVANPFKELALDHGNGLIYPYQPEDGKGLNPLLQYFAMLIHPPILYLGYIGTAAPFAFAIAALITKHKSSAWIRTTRRWAIISWAFLGMGILLGAKWAYVELGWGGYWAWDPVENASLMPWLTATAFLHSVMIQEKKGMLKIWNMILVMITFLISIFGTFLTRSGIVNSVHAFAQSNIGPYFISFIGLASLFCLILLLCRLPFLKSERTLESLVSREAGFLLNNWILLAACFAVLWGTIFPVISEAIQGQKITVGAPFFNKVNIPIGIILLFLTGVGPLLAWRKTSWASLKKNFSYPILASLLFALVIGFFGVRHLYAWMTLSLSFFVSLTIFLEFYRGTQARHRSTGENIFISLINLTRKNACRYGGYIVHVGIVMIFIGMSGNAFNQETKTALKEGESLKIKNYTLVCKEIRQEDNPNYESGIVRLDLFKNNRFLKQLQTEKRFYKASEQPTSEVAIYSTLIEDFYAVFADFSESDNKVLIQVFLNPLVQWVWVGGLVIVFGTLILLLPERVMKIITNCQLN